MSSEVNADHSASPPPRTPSPHPGEPTNLPSLLTPVIKKTFLAQDERIITLVSNITDIINRVRQDMQSILADRGLDSNSFLELVNREMEVRLSHYDALQLRDAYLYIFENSIRFFSAMKEMADNPEHIAADLRTPPSEVRPAPAPILSLLNMLYRKLQKKLEDTETMYFLSPPDELMNRLHKTGLAATTPSTPSSSPQEKLQITPRFYFSVIEQAICFRQKRKREARESIGQQEVLRGMVRSYSCDALSNTRTLKTVGKPSEKTFLSTPTKTSKTPRWNLFPYRKLFGGLLLIAGAIVGILSTLAIFSPLGLIGGALGYKMALTGLGLIFADACVGVVCAATLGAAGYGVRAAIHRCQKPLSSPSSPPTTPRQCPAARNTLLDHRPPQTITSPVKKSSCKRKLMETFQNAPSSTVLVGQFGFFRQATPATPSQRKPALALAPGFR